MLNKADQLRAKFQKNDPVSFGKRKKLVGKIIRFNRTTATIHCDGTHDEYRVPFEQLERLTPPTGPAPEQQLEKVVATARHLLAIHHLTDWTFHFDHSTRRAGCCNFRDKQISISFELARNATDPDILDTLLHEIAHALVGKKHHHDATWKAKAIELGSSGERCHRLQFATPRYHMTCENHCWKHTAERRNPRLRCRTCGGKIIYSPHH